MESTKAPSGRPSQRQRLLEARITKLEGDAKAMEAVLTEAVDKLEAMAEAIRRVSRL